MSCFSPNGSCHRPVSHRAQRAGGLAAGGPPPERSEASTAGGWRQDRSRSFAHGWKPSGSMPPVWRRCFVQKGFTLLEIMIAMAILSISLLALYTSMGNSLRISGSAEDTDQATQLARKKMTEILMSLDEDIARGAFPEEKEENGTFDKPFEKYKWSYAIKKVQIPVLQPPSNQAAGSVGEGSSKGATPSGATPGQTTPGLENAAANMAQMVTKKISESIRELKLTVSWGENPDDEEKVVLTTHLSKLR